MANEPLPAYLATAKPNPFSNRAPWYMNTAPSYAGIFLWIAFYQALGQTLPVGGLWASLAGLAVGAVLCYILFYKVFGMIGMKTGLPLYVVGSSTFGTKGGYLFPGVFMGLLQIGWYSVATYMATELLLKSLVAFNMLESDQIMTLYGPGKQGFSTIFVIVAIAWGYLFALFGALGIKYVGRISQYFPIVPIVMLIIAAIGGLSACGDYCPGEQHVGGLAGMCLMIQMVIGFFATAGAAGVDFGLNNRDHKDVSRGGMVGVILAAIFAGGLALIAVAGAHAKQPDLESFTFADSLNVLNPKLASLMWLLFAIGSVAPACFCAFIIGNSLSTMMPSLPRIPLTLGGATIGIILAALGIAGNLGAFFGLIGASFGPICGAMVADYLISGKKWVGPREGINLGGYLAWLIGFAVGISNNPVVTNLLGQELIAGWHPTPVYSFVVGFVVYAVITKSWGIQDAVVDVPNLKQ